MVNQDYASAFNKALNIYTDKQYVSALHAFQSLLKRKGLSAAQEAQLNRRIANCYVQLGNSSKALPLYDHALQLAQDDDYSRCWIFESKANALASLDKYDEAIDCYAEAIKLVNDPEDLEYLEQQFHELMSKYELYKVHGNFPEWKKDILNKILKSKKQLEEDDFWQSAQGKNIIKD
ncbi:hypothetical protein C5B42_05680 [Candidatus Cerribacteria bacterium 'Amazon FNV 2010 28 9']|uniref:Uncharacterized protein n=1 Tax=Candidatus Cerribacteria bacterium 'Amazon FNV 2010 28 9' TaxID=2081795 RepID=A0A317JND7_9BACT|nr:MAG: hypothetical protein C5B42_05680 [Candidatus Cerribacteria bacterium 'Amazon FNV 2010 28 9']